jgi:hypothetical protein
MNYWNTYKTLLKQKKIESKKFLSKKKLRITGIIRVPVDFNLAIDNSKNELQEIDNEAAKLVKLAKSHDKQLEFLEDYIKFKLSLLQHRVTSLNSALSVLAYFCGLILFLLLSKFLSLPWITGITVVAGILIIIFKTINDINIFKNLISYEYLLIVISRARKTISQIAN